MKVMSAQEKIGKSIVKSENGCWLWQGAKNGKGYATHRVSKGKVSVVHKFYYELVKGPVPKGLVLDHLCRIKHCVNPDHLEPVTNQENVLRGLRFHIDDIKLIIELSESKSPEEIVDILNKGKR